MNQIKSPTPIAILLATYNGKQYLCEQIESLLRQTSKDWTLYIHDDGSTDGTSELLHDYALRYQNIVVLDYESQHGAKDNFLSLLQRVDAEYYMFCDQDDVWIPEKVALSINEIKLQEKAYANTPLIVYTDLHVADAQLNITHPSFWKEICLHPEFVTSFDEIAASTAATGCAMILNSLAKAVTIIPAPKATMHDAWITACVLSKGGRICPLHRQTVYYRQHGDNCVGAEDLNHLSLTYRIKNLREMQLKNWRNYQMLRSLGYGSLLKFMRYKLLYNKRISRKKA
ncbi:MAG: glycosyltransferase family 2 protein [Prevotella sp.]|nr:glycosyltransferase family 2 protein [Prevotella sp.]